MGGLRRRPEVEGGEQPVQAGQEGAGRLQAVARERRHAVLEPQGAVGIRLGLGLRHLSGARGLNRGLRRGDAGEQVEVAAHRMVGGEALQPQGAVREQVGRDGELDEGHRAGDADPVGIGLQLVQLLAFRGFTGGVGGILRGGILPRGLGRGGALEETGQGVSARACR